MIDLWVCDYKEMTDPALWQEWENTFDKKTSDKILAHRMERGRQEQLASAWLLRLACKAAGLDLSKQIVGHGRYGKPYLESSALHFNVSHSFPYVICAISDQSVGCDVEGIRVLRDSVVNRCFSSAEMNQLDLDRDTCTTLLWTLKESYLKKCGTGITVPMRDYEMVYHKNKKCFQVCKDQVLLAEEIRTYRIGSSYISICQDTCSKEAVKFHTLCFKDTKYEEIPLTICAF